MTRIPDRYLLPGMTSATVSVDVVGDGAVAAGVIDVSVDGSLLVRQINYLPYSPLKDCLRSTTMERIFLEYLEAVEAARRGP